MPILMNKFYYFTLNYYCIYESEKNKNLEIISNSSLISFYIFIWNMILILIKSNIPDNSADYNYFKILYILQITFASLLSLFIVIFIVGGLVASLGFIQYL